MRVEKLSLDDFRPLVEAIEEQAAAAAAFSEKKGAAQELLNQINRRQREGAAEIVAMLEELSKEEAALRRQVREETNRRAKARLAGQKPPETDNSAGARLAAIPDERAALDALRGVKEMTPEEREEWETLHSDASDAGDRLRAANRAVNSALQKWRAYFTEAAQIAALSTEDASLAYLERDAYALNSNPASSEDDEDGGEWSVAYGVQED